MGGFGVKVQHFPLTLLVVLTTLTLPCERDVGERTEALVCDRVVYVMSYDCAFSVNNFMNYMHTR